MFRKKQVKQPTEEELKKSLEPGGNTNTPFEGDIQIAEFKTKITSAEQKAKILSMIGDLEKMFHEPVDIVIKNEKDFNKYKEKALIDQLDKADS